jgi:hypothetical protein
MYFPKNKIKTGLYASGGEFTTANGLDYNGPYWKTSNGEAYTGTSPNSTPYQRLFAKIPNIRTANIIPVETIMPTEDDYKLGEFQRFFTKRRNQMLYSEITKTTYTNILQSKINTYGNYILFNLSWKLTGDIITTFQVNKSMVQLTERNISLDGLSIFLNNYIQYYRYTPQNNLYTGGGEFLTSTGVDYVGPYSIDINKGYTVGSTGSNDILTPYITNTSKDEVIGVGLTNAHKKGITKTETIKITM